MGRRVKLRAVRQDLKARAAVVKTPRVCLDGEFRKGGFRWFMPEGFLATLRLWLEIILSWTRLLVEPTLGGSCMEPYREVTRTFSHELVEACTDPEGTGFQVFSA